MSTKDCRRRVGGCRRKRGQLSGGAVGERRARSRPGVYQRRDKWFFTLDVKDTTTGKWRKSWSKAYRSQAEAFAARIEALGRKMSTPAGQ